VPDTARAFAWVGADGGDAVGGAAAVRGVRVCGGEDGGVPRAGAVGVRRRRGLRVLFRVHPPDGAARAVHARVAHGRRHAIRLPPLLRLPATPARRRRPWRRPRCSQDHRLHLCHCRRFISHLHTDQNHRFFSF
jgi:hypothetical protein